MSSLVKRFNRTCPFKRMLRRNTKFTVNQAMLGMLKSVKSVGEFDDYVVTSPYYVSIILNTHWHSTTRLHRGSCREHF